jgi:hypothetical protein
MMKTWAAVCAAVVALLTTDCTVPPIGQPCTLVKKDPSDPAGLKSIPITEGEIANQQQKDYLSLGATDCEDLVCVRSANHWPDNPDPNAAATGECSTSCSPNAQGGCITGTHTDTEADAFTCRALVLDAEVLSMLRQQHPEWNLPQSEYFCARPLGVSN